MPLSVTCPSCHDHLDVDEGYRTWKVRCPGCGHEFIPDDILEKSQQTINEFDQSIDDEDDRPRRRRRRRGRRLSSGEVEDRAREMIAAPAMVLRILGVIFLIIGIFGIAFAIVVGSMAANQPAAFKNGNNDPDEVWLNCVLLGAGSVISMIISPFIIIGANKATNLTSHAWAMASAILAISSILGCYCSFFFGVPIGIWALVMLSKSEVREGFDIVARRDNRNKHAEDENEDEEEY